MKANSDLSVDIMKNIQPKTLEGHSAALKGFGPGTVNSFASLPNGWLASGGSDTTIKLWDVESGQCIKTLRGHPCHIQSLVLLSNKQQLASCGGNNAIRIWDIESGQCVKILQAQSKSVYSLAVLSDGKLVSGGGEDMGKWNVIQVWDIESGQCVKILPGHFSGTVLSLIALGSDQLVSSSGDNTIKIWDIEHGQLHKTLQGGHTSVVSSLALLQHGLLASGSWDKTIKIWDIETGQCVRTLQGHADWVLSLTVLSNGVLASGSRDGTIKLWSVMDDQCLKTLQGHAGWVLSLSTLSKSGTLVSGSGVGENTIKLWPVMDAFQSEISQQSNPLPPSHSLKTSSSITEDNNSNLNKPPIQIEPVAEKSWHFDPATKASVGANKEVYSLLPATQKDFDKVLQHYQHHPYPGKDIAKVQVIYNRTFNRAFELRMQALQQRNGNSAFAPKWSKEHAPDWRQKVQNLFENLSAPYTDPDYPAVKLLPLWHGTKPSILKSIFETGYANLAETDDGYFGRGIYSAYEAEYAERVYSKGALILNWVCVFSAYPTIDGDMKKLMGKGNYQNYDAHFIPVIPPSGKFSQTEVVYYPCKPNQKHQYIEVVVFDSQQCLPRYLVELQPSLPKSPFHPIRDFERTITRDAILFLAKKNIHTKENNSNQNNESTANINNQITYSSQQ